MVMPVSPTPGKTPLIGTPDEDESDDSSPLDCFIATAAYDSYLDPHVQLLREFRDRNLINNGPGRALISIYNWGSPSIASYISRRETLRSVTRLVLTPAVLSIKHPLVFGIASVVSAGVLVRLLSSQHRRHRSSM